MVSYLLETGMEFFIQELHPALFSRNYMVWVQVEDEVCVRTAILDWVGDYHHFFNDHFGRI